jgi:hypothetical protein
MRRNNSLIRPEVSTMSRNLLPQHHRTIHRKNLKTAIKILD